MFARSILITGCSRGIGLEFVKQILKLQDVPEFIFATCRSPASATQLNEIASQNKNVIVLELDTTKYDTFGQVRDTVASYVGDHGLNVLFNNAGILKYDNTIQSLTAEELMKSYECNAVGPALLAQAFLPLLRKAAAYESGKPIGIARSAILNMSTLASSLDDNQGGGAYPYRMSKVALNMLSKNMSIELKGDGILVVILHPGYVETDMTGPSAKWSTEESVLKFLDFLPTLNDQHNGGFYWCDGRAIHW